MVMMGVDFLVGYDPYGNPIYMSDYDYWDYDYLI